MTYEYALTFWPLLIMYPDIFQSAIGWSGCMVLAFYLVRMLLDVLYISITSLSITNSSFTSLTSTFSSLDQKRRILCSTS
jgi:hypothetical protein